MKLCKFYLRGECHFGSRCRNSHQQGRHNTSTRSKKNEIEKTYREIQETLETLSISALTQQNCQYNYLYSLPDSEDFSVYIRGQSDTGLFIRHDLLCFYEPTPNFSHLSRFEFLFRKQSDASYLILDNHDCGRVIGYDNERSTIMTVSPSDPRSISWIVEQIGPNIKIKHIIQNRYWCIKTLTTGSSKLYLQEGSSSEFSLIETSIREEQIPMVRNIKLLPPLLRASQNLWDVRINNSDKDANIVVATGGLEAYALTTMKNYGRSFLGTGQTYSWAQARANHGLQGKGKYYYEGQQARTLHSPGFRLCRMGYSIIGAKELGHDAFSWGYGGTAKRSTKKSFEDYGISYNIENIIGCLLNLDAKTISFSVDGIYQGVAFHIPENMDSMALFPTIALNGGQISLNFGAKPFAHLPLGFCGVVNADLQNIVLALPHSHARVRQHNFRLFYSGLSAYLEPLSEPARSLKFLHEKYEIALAAQKVFLSNPAVKILMLEGSIYRNLIVDYL